MHYAKFIKEIKVYDPDSHMMVSVSIYKDETSDAMFGIDSILLQKQK